MYESHDDFSQIHINTTVNFSWIARALAGTYLPFALLRKRLIKFNIKTTVSLLHSNPSLSIGNDFREKHFALHAVAVIFPFIFLFATFYSTLFGTLFVFSAWIAQKREIFFPLFNGKSIGEKFHSFFLKFLLLPSDLCEMYLFYLFIIFSARLWNKWKHKHERSVCLLLDFVDIQYYLEAILRFSGQCRSLFDMKISRARKFDPKQGNEDWESLEIFKIIFH